MSKVITFSRYFPKSHPRAGGQTFFVEKLWTSFVQLGYKIPYKKRFSLEFLSSLCNDRFKAKPHTIRAGNRFKAGEYFSPRVWSGNPYCSKQITICEDVLIKKVYEIEILKTHEILINGVWFASFGSKNCEEIANNDGLNMKDFTNWFNKIPFKGQVICWGEVSYE